MKKVFLTIVLYLSVISVTGQVRVQSAMQQLVESTVKDAIVEISSQYIVRDKENGKTYRKEDQEYFGEISSIGVLTTNGLVLTSQALTPWESDSSFFEYKDSYDGILHKIIAIVNGKQIAIDSNITTLKIKGEENLYLINTIDSLPGLKYKEADGTIDGWIILQSKTKDGSVITTSFNSKTTFKKGTKSSEIDRPLYLNNLLGGLYVTPDFTSVGVVEFHLCGIIAERDEKIVIIPLGQISRKSKTTLIPNSVVVPNPPEGKKLVPVFGSKDEEINAAPKGKDGKKKGKKK